MGGGRAAVLGEDERAFLEAQRVARLATTDAAGAPHVVPVCFAVQGVSAYIAIDRKPKSGRPLKRLRNIAENPNVTLTADHYDDDDWSRLRWVMVRGHAEILEGGAEHDDARGAELARRFATRPPLEWEKLLTDADVACVKAEDRGMYFFFNEDPHVRENRLLVEVEATRHGRFWRYAPVVDFSAASGRAGPAPLRGEHTRPVLRELGYAETQILDFRERGIADWEEA